MKHLSLSTVLFMLSVIALLLIPAPAFAAAGFADAYHDRQQWIFPAYSYCLIFGLALLLGLFIISLLSLMSH